MKYIAIICDGSRQIHASADPTGNYATLCGLDGNDPSDLVRQSAGPLKRGEKIDCPHIGHERKPFKITLSRGARK